MLFNHKPVKKTHKGDQCELELRFESDSRNFSHFPCANSRLRPPRSEDAAVYPDVYLCGASGDVCPDVWNRPPA